MTGRPLSEGADKKRIAWRSECNTKIALY